MGGCYFLPLRLEARPWRWPRDKATGTAAHALSKPWFYILYMVFFFSDI